MEEFKCPSDRALADRLGVAASTLRSLRAGARNPTQATLRRIARAAGVDPDWLRTGQAAPPAPRALPAAASAPEAARPLHLFAIVDMDGLVAAFQAAQRLMASRGVQNPSPRRLLQTTLLLYDEATDALPK